MDERLPQQGPEQHDESGEHDPYKVEKRHEAVREQIEKAAEHHKPKSHEDISRLEKEIEKKAESAQELSSELESQQTNRDSDKRYRYSSSESIPRAVTQARKQLKPAERAVSKVIHNPKIEAISSVTGATVARPSGFMYGAIFSFIATLGFLVISKRYGYEYNAFVGVLTFIAGYLAGLIVELITRTIRHPKKH